MSTLDDMQGLARRLVQPLKAWFVPQPVATTYTPIYYGATMAGTTTYTLQNGRYVRLGSVVHIWGQVLWTAATGTGNGRISLPFTAVANTPVVLRISGNYAWTNNEVQGLIPAGTDYIRIESVTSGGAATVEAVQGAGNIIFQATIEIA